MIWLKLAVPAVMAAIGGGALVTAAVATNDPAPVGASQVWIDGPAGIDPLGPGSVPVTAHATALADVTGLELYVDGKKTDTDSDLDRTEKLFLGEFMWNAAVGVHELVVKQVGGTGSSSEVRHVVISAGSPAPATTTTTSTTIPGDTTTSSSTTSSTTSTTTPDTTTTLAPPETDDTTPVTFPPPVTTAPPPPTPAPVISSTSIASTNANRIYVMNCAYTLTVYARVSDADQVRVKVDGTGFNQTMARNGSSYSLTIGSGPSLWSSGNVGTHTVTVEATSPGGTVRSSAGSLTIIYACPKD